MTGLLAWEAARAAACPSVQNARRVHLLGVGLIPDGLVSSLHLSEVIRYQKGGKTSLGQGEARYTPSGKQHREQAKTASRHTAGVLTIDGDPRVAGLHVGHSGGLHHKDHISTCYPRASH